MLIFRESRHPGGWKPEVIAPNTLLHNRYLVVQQLGQGGMGAVYQAIDQRFGSTVALKETLVSGEPLLKAFEREARLLNSLRHAALPHVFDYFFEGQGQFLVMQYIPGEDLGALLKRHGRPFPVDQVVRWADQLLDLLDYLHRHEPPIIHRDIKPENLKLTDRGDIILLDFGLAKGATNTTRLSTSSVVGYTPSFAPFEQIRGTGTDARSDLYSLAATLYALLTAQLPYDALTRAENILNGIPDPMRPVHELQPGVPIGISNVLHKALALKRDDRPASASAMRAALRAAASMSNISQATMVEAVRHPPVHPSQAWAGGTTPSITMHDTSHASVPTAAGRTEPPPSSGSARTVLAITVLAVVLLAILGGGGYVAWLAVNMPERAGPAPVPPSPGPAPVPAAEELTFTRAASITSPVMKVYEVAFSPDGSMLASAGSEPGIRLWRVADGGLISELRGHSDIARSVAFSADGTKVASGSERGEVRVWRPADGKLLQTFNGHTRAVYAVSFSSDGGTLASACIDNTLRLWSLGSGSSQDERHRGAVLAVDGGAGVLAFSTSDGIAFRGLVDDRQISNLRLGAEVNSATFSADGGTFAVGGVDGVVRLVKVADGTITREIKAHTGAVSSLAFFPGAGLLASGGADGATKIWRTDTGAQVKVLEGHSATVFTMAVSRDGRLLSSGGYDGKIMVWRVEGGNGK